MEPHPVLYPHYTTKEEKQPFLRKVFDEAAPFYESIAKWGWFGSGHWYRKGALARHGLKEGMRVIDVAAGTGPTARAVLDIVGSESLITCVEPSVGMINESKKLLNCEHIEAMAHDMPVDSDAYDYLTMGFALRHVENLEESFKEYYRVVKKDAKVLILDVTLPKSKAGRFFMKLYFKHTLPFLTRIFTGSKSASYLMSYYWETLENMVPPEVVLAALRNAGFTNVSEHVVIGIFTEYEATKSARYTITRILLISSP